MKTGLQGPKVRPGSLAPLNSTPRGVRPEALKQADSLSRQASLFLLETYFSCLGGGASGI